MILKNGCDFNGQDYIYSKSVSSGGKVTCSSAVCCVRLKIRHHDVLKILDRVSHQRTEIGILQLLIEKSNQLMCQR